MRAAEVAAGAPGAGPAASDQSHMPYDVSRAARCVRLSNCACSARFSLLRNCLQGERDPCMPRLGRLPCSCCSPCRRQGLGTDTPVLHGPGHMLLVALPAPHNRPPSWPMPHTA